MLFLLLIIFTLATGTFGLFRNISWLFIHTPVGTFEIGQILLIIALLICFFKRRKRRINIKDHIILPYILLLLLILFQAFRNIFEGMDIQLVLRGIKSMYMLFFLLPFIILIKNKKQLNQFIKFIILIGFICALVAIFQFITGKSVGISEAREYSYGFKRIYHPGGVLMAFCFFICLSNFLHFKLRRGFIYFIIAPILMIAILTTLHRSLIGITLMISFLLYLSYLFYNEKTHTLLKSLLLILPLLIICFYFIQKSGFGLEALIERGNSAISDIRYNEGSFHFRMLLLVNTFNAVINKSPLFGVGFNYSPKGFVWNPFSLTWDNMYVNLLLIFGLIGLVFLLILFINISKTSLKMYKSSMDLQDKAIYLALFSLPILCFLIGFFSQFFSSSTNLPVLISGIGILYLMKLFQEQKLLQSKLNSVMINNK